MKNKPQPPRPAQTQGYESVKETRAGYPVKEVEFNHFIKLYIGLIADPKRGQGWTPSAWRSSGKCVNPNRPDCDLVLPPSKPKPSL